MLCVNKYVMEKEVVTITLERFSELTMLENRNRIQEAKIEELLKEIRELKKNKNNNRNTDC